MSNTRRFVDPLAVPTVPGTEGWEQMYSYYLLFHREDPTRIAYERDQFWFRDSIHLPEPMAPLDPNLACDMNFSGVSAIANRALSIPVLKGYEPRVLNGYVYIRGIEPQGPEEIQQRAAIFEPRIGHLFRDWGDFFERWTQECDLLIEEMKQLDFAELLDVEPQSIMTEFHRHYPGYELYRQYLQLWDIMLRMSQQTKKALLPSYGADAVFMQNMRTLFPGISDTAITRIAGGFESKLFRAVEELQRLAQSAFEAGLSAALSSAASWAEAEATLQRSAPGRRWLQAFEAARDPWFEMSSGEGWQRECLAWNDDLDIPLGHLQDYVRALAEGRSIERPREKVLAERERVTAEYRSLIPNEQDARAFDGLVGLTRMVAPASEDHSIYQGSWFHSLYSRKLRRIGELLLNHGILAEAEDVFMLNRQELDSVVWEMYTSWCRGVEPAARYHWPKRIQRRKDILERFRDWSPPPALGIVPQTITAPPSVVQFGVTPALVNTWWEAGRVAPQETKSLSGFAGAAGMVEGVARICRSVQDICTLKPGEIMVTPNTAPTWAPAFVVASAVVTDMGGIFGHTAIVAREYGIPAVVGTGYATTRIQSGDQIRVDGDAGLVTILERAG